MTRITLILADIKENIFPLLESGEIFMRQHLTASSPSDALKILPARALLQSMCIADKK